jgi:ribonuclease VapC
MIDASVLLAILLDEPDASDWGRKIDRIPEPFTTPAAIAEVALRLVNLSSIPTGRIERGIARTLERLRIRVADLPAESWLLAADAARRYGKGRHPAALNFGDCLAYAAARQAGACLIYKGDDFALTDVNDGLA